MKMTNAIIIGDEYLCGTKTLAHSMTTLQLFEAVRVYLKNRIEHGGKEIVSEDNLADEILSEEEFRIYHNEIVRREIKINSLEYLELFQEMMVDAKVTNEMNLPRRFYS